MFVDEINILLKDVIYISSGIFMTLQLLFGALFIGLLGGTFFAVCRYMNIGKYFVDILVSILRGTPVILQISFVYFTSPSIFGGSLSVLNAGILTLGLNSSAYISEILRSSIESLPKGQFEAAKSLQIPTFYMWKDIILPQVVRNVLPALINEVISLLKETALIGTIGGMDIMRTSQVLAAQKFTYFLPLCMAGLYYYLMVLLIAYLGKCIEKWNNYAKN